MSTRTVLVISSHVARGSVGLRAISFALERLGFTVWAVPTVLLPHHPGHGAVTRIVPDEDRFAELLDALLQRAGNAPISAVLSGYLASASQAEAVAGLVGRIKAAQPGTLYLCDPVIGDNDRLYVDTRLAEAIRDKLLPLADLATPNRFECAWLAGDSSMDEDLNALASLAARLARPAVVVTSAPALMCGKIANLLVHDGGAVLAEHPLIQTAVKGTGDLLAAILLARRLEGQKLPKALELATSSTFEIVAATAKAGADELMLPESQQAIVQPRASVHLRRIAALI